MVINTQTKHMERQEFHLFLDQFAYLNPKKPLLSTWEWNLLICGKHSLPLALAYANISIKVNCYYLLTMLTELPTFYSIKICLEAWYLGY